MTTWSVFTNETGWIGKKFAQSHQFRWQKACGAIQKSFWMENWNFSLDLDDSIKSYSSNLILVSFER